MNESNIGAIWRIATGVSMLDLTDEARERVADKVYEALRDYVPNFPIRGDLFQSITAFTSRA